MKTTIFLLLLSSSVQADWTVHTVSDHLKTTGLNNINPGIAYDFTPNFRAGGLYNSYHRPSFYAVGLAHVNSRLRLGAGVISGYKLHGKDVGKGSDTSIIPLIAVEYDLTKHVSIAWFGEVLNLELKF